MTQLKLYKASAGSGKTYTIALEYIRELLVNNSRDAHRHILAVTFTNDATGEMKTRILAELYGLAFGSDDSSAFRSSLQDLLQEEGCPMSEAEIKNRAFTVLHAILHDYSRVLITTIDSFFQKIVRNLARELGKGSRFSLELDNFSVRKDAVNSVIERANQDSKLLHWLTAYVQTKLENDGNWRIKKEIFDFSSCIYDEFFQEHESLLRKQLENNTSVFENLQNEQQRIQKDCKQGFKQHYFKLLSILDANNLEASDFNYRGAIINFWRKLAENPNNGISLTKERYLDDASPWVTKSHKRREEIMSLVDSQLMALFKETLLLYEKYLNAKLIAGNIHQLGLIWYITNEIDALNLENNRFMLADTALFLNRMIDDSDAPFIYEKIGSEIRHVMIDEFQDTSRLQWSNFKALLNNLLSGNNFSMIVGDVKQSIYRWRNGDWRILNNVPGEYALQVRNLDFNYRSQKQVVDFNNFFFSETGLLLDRKMREDLPDLADSPFQSIYTEAEVSQKIPSSGNRGFVSLDFPNTDGEMKYKDQILSRLLLKIQELHAAGIPPEAICILTRKNDEIITVANFFAGQKHDFPELNKKNYLNIVSNEAFELRSSLAVKIIVEALKVLSNPRNPVYRVQLEHYLGIAYPESSQATADKTSYEEPDIHLSELPLPELVSHLYNQYRLEQIEDQSAYLFFFLDEIDSYLKNHSGSLAGFIAYWDEKLSRKTIPIGEGLEGIRAMTIHKSKGLQFHTVLMPFCSWELNPQMSPVVWCAAKEGVYELELLPVNYSSRMNETVFTKEYQQETMLSWLDNLNLLYVAFTRAEENLILFGKWKKDLKSLQQVKTVSDLLQWIVPQMQGSWDAEACCYETGALSVNPPKKAKQSDNPLKQTPEILPVAFRSETFSREKPLFKQSNKSREFINPEAKTKDSYVAYGNVMHELFARVRYLPDIPYAVDSLISEGIIRPQEQEMYADKVRSAIAAVGTEDWFGTHYTIYSERSVILAEQGEITTKRPDRILLSDDSTLIVDYKFGEARSSHKKQMQEYVRLLETMNYPDIQAYLWYVEENRIEKVS